MWTLLLTSTGVTGLWLVARHWWGWLLYLLNEVLWLVYAIGRHDQPLMVMACIWGMVGTRNLTLAYLARRPHADH